MEEKAKPPLWLLVGNRKDFKAVRKSGFDEGRIERKSLLWV